VSPEKDYLLVKKLEETKTASGLVVLNSLINLVDIIADGTGEGREGLTGILQQPPENDLNNGLFLTHKNNLVGTAVTKEKE